jgi:hypothetical protein
MFFFLGFLFLALGAVPLIATLIKARSLPPDKLRKRLTRGGAVLALGLAGPDGQP